MVYDNGNGIVWSDDIREEVVRLPDEAFDEEENDKYGYYGIGEVAEATKGLGEDESIVVSYSEKNNFLSYALTNKGVKALPIFLGDFVPLFMTKKELSREEIAEKVNKILEEKK